VNNWSVSKVCPVTDGHGVSSLQSHDEYTRKILTAIESGRPVTHRSLSRELNVALGLANLLVRRLVSKGYVKVTTIPRNRVKYLLTPAGLAEKTRVSKAYLDNTVRLYTETRERIRESLERVSADLATRGLDKRIVFYGAGEVAEIAFISLQRTDLQLVGIVDDRIDGCFFGMPVHRLDNLADGTLLGERFAQLGIMSIRKADQMSAKLEAIGFPSSRIFTL
jgi:Mn-dependent DtxR family transcriptional regulator